MARSVASRITLTDKQALGPDSLAGAALKDNLAVLKHLGGSGEPPQTGISIFEIPEELKTPGAIFLAGSPAGNGPRYQHTEADPYLNNVNFKEAAFYSLCHHTPTFSAIVMTYSPSACGRRLEFWTLPEEDPPRALLVLPAWFARYVPRKGIEDSLEALADERDTMVAMYVPPLWLQGLIWASQPGAENQLDMAATLINWLGADTQRRIVSFAAYTAELEVDIATANLSEEEMRALSLAMLPKAEAERPGKKARILEE